MHVELVNDNKAELFARALGVIGEQRARVAFAHALNKVGDKGRTRVKRALAQATGVKYGAIPMRTIRANPWGLTYTIEQSGDETNLNLFGARQGARGVSARPWGTRRVFKGTFIVPGWGAKVYSRDGAARFPVSPLWGPNLAREVLKEKPVEAFEATTGELQTQIENQVQRALMASLGV